MICVKSFELVVFIDSECDFICFGFLLYCLKECVFDLSMNWFRGVWLLRKWKKTKEKKGKEMENYWSLSLAFS